MAWGIFMTFITLEATSQAVSEDLVREESAHEKLDLPKAA